MLKIRVKDMMKGFGLKTPSDPFAPFWATPACRAFRQVPLTGKEPKKGTPMAYRQASTALPHGKRIGMEYIWKCKQQLYKKEPRKALFYCIMRM